MRQSINALFPADNITAQLCDEQKYFNRHIARFSNIIPYGKLCVPESELAGCTFIIEPSIVDKNHVVKKCVALTGEEPKTVALFILGSFNDEEGETVRSLLLQNKFPALSFNTFYTCTLLINDEKFFHWYVKNIRWHTGKKVRR